MTFAEYFFCILSSSREDWNVMLAWGQGAGPSYREQLIESWSRDSGKWLEVRSHSMVATLRTDIDISLAFGLECNEDFQESWINVFPDPKASSHFVDFFYRGTLVHRDVYVTVDGGRGHLPLPEVKYNSESRKIVSYTITEDADKFYRLFNQLESARFEYLQYRENARFVVVPGSWPT